jgi:hypothetical protein
VLDIAQALLGDRGGGDLDRLGGAGAAVAATSTRPGAVARPADRGGGGAVVKLVLVHDVAQELGRRAEGGGNLDPLGGAGDAVALAGAVLAVLALDRG